MSMAAELAAAKARWEEERRLYADVAEKTETTIREALRARCILATVSHRVKETASMLRKLIRKQITYDELTDKAGVRLVTYFVSDTDAVRELIRTTFEVTREDDKRAELSPWSLGYSGIHYDIMVSEGERILPCEIQLRSIGENAWAEISHVLAYKGSDKIPLNVRRRLNTLSALLEVADAQFDEVRKRVAELPESEPLRILNLLEEHFVQLAASDYDRELSMDFLCALMPLVLDTYGNEVESELNAFVDSNREALERVFSSESTLQLAWSPMILQPESILVFALLDRAPMKTESRWPAAFPHDLLEELKRQWCVPEALGM